MIAPLTTPATPALSGLFAARSGPTALNMGSGYFLRPDGSRQRYSSPPPSYSPPPQQYQPPPQQYAPPPQQYAPPPQQYAPPPQQYAPPPQQYAPQPAYGAPQQAGVSAQNAGDLPPTGWGGEGKAHSRDPTPTQLDPNDPKAKQTHIPTSESFEEYMRRRQQGF